MVKRLYPILKREASRAGKPLRSAGSLLLNYLYPPCCPGCELPMAAASGVCHRCRLLLESSEDIRRWSRRSDFRYLAGPLFLSYVAAGWEYSPVLGRIIQRIKYGGRPRLGVRMGSLLAERLHHVLSGAECDLMLPVPLHSLRKRERGYNQSSMIVRGMSSVLRVPCGCGILRRIKPTVTQTALSGDQRQTNTARAFQVRDATAIAGKKVLLVDDVVTTGATINSAAGALINAGAAGVAGVALARPVLGSEDIRVT